MITWRGPLKRTLAYCSYDRVTIIIFLLRAKTCFVLLFKKRKMRDRYLLNTPLVYDLNFFLNVKHFRNVFRFVSYVYGVRLDGAAASSVLGCASIR